MNVLTATPAQIDTEIARINGEIAVQEGVIEAHGRRYSRVTEEQVAVAREEIAALVPQVRALAHEFERRGGWTRYYLVEGGHLHSDHSSFRCSRQLTTAHFWMVDLSGRPAAEVIELAGERVCTVCFPEAPVAVQQRPSQLQTATEIEKARAAGEREQKRTADAIKKAAKAIIDPATGGPLRIGNIGEIKTERTAMVEIVEQMWWREFAGEHGAQGYHGERDADIVKLAEALAYKHETTVEQELAAAEARLVARKKREARQR